MTREIDIQLVKKWKALATQAERELLAAVVGMSTKQLDEECDFWLFCKLIGDGCMRSVSVDYHKNVLRASYELTYWTLDAAELQDAKKLQLPFAAQMELAGSYYAPTSLGHRSQLGAILPQTGGLWQLDVMFPLEANIGNLCLAKALAKTMGHAPWLHDLLVDQRKSSLASLAQYIASALRLDDKQMRDFKRFCNQTEKGFYEET